MSLSDLKRRRRRALCGRSLDTNAALNLTTRRVNARMHVARGLRSTPIRPMLRALECDAFSRWWALRCEGPVVTSGVSNIGGELEEARERGQRRGDGGAVLLACEYAPLSSGLASMGYVAIGTESGGVGLARTGTRFHPEGPNVPSSSSSSSSSSSMHSSFSFSATSSPYLSSSSSSPYERTISTTTSSSSSSLGGQHCHRGLYGAQQIDVKRVHTDAIFDVAWLDQGTPSFVTAAADPSCTIIDAVTLSPTATFISGHKTDRATARCVATQPDSAHVFASGARNGAVCVWDMRDTAVAGASGRHYHRPSASINARGATMATSSITGLIFGGDGHSLYSAGAAGIVELWDVRKTYSIHMRGRSRPLAVFAPPAARPGGGRAAGISSLAHAMSSLHTKSCLGGGRLLVSTLGSAAFVVDGLGQTGDLPGVSELHGHVPASFYDRCRLGPDGRTAAISSAGGTWIWDLGETTTTRRTSLTGGRDEDYYNTTNSHASSPSPLRLESHLSGVNGLSMHPGESLTIATCADDGSLHVWRCGDRDGGGDCSSGISSSCPSSLWQRQREMRQSNMPWAYQKVVEECCRRCDDSKMAAAGARGRVGLSISGDPTIRERREETPPRDSNLFGSSGGSSSSSRSGVGRSGAYVRNGGTNGSVSSVDSVAGNGDAGGVGDGVLGSIAIAVASTDTSPAQPGEEDGRDEEVMPMRASTRRQLRIDEVVNGASAAARRRRRRRQLPFPQMYR